jgi:hypothetical protein
MLLGAIQKLMLLAGTLTCLEALLFFLIIFYSTTFFLINCTPYDYAYLRLYRLIKAGAIVLT